MSDRVFLRGEGGVVTEYDVPLHWAIEKRLVKGYLVRVANAAGDPYEPPVEPTAEPLVPDVPTERPAIEARKPEWVGWAVAESARRGEPISADAAEAATKQDLIEKYGADPVVAETVADPDAPIAEGEAGSVVTADGVEHVGVIPASAAEPTEQ